MRNDDDDGTFLSRLQWPNINKFYTRYRSKQQIKSAGNRNEMEL